MSKIVQIDNENIHYICDENSTEYILGSSGFNNDDLNDIICSDGTRAYYLNGHIISGDTQTIVLQHGDNLSQYYIKDEEQILVASDQSMSNSNSIDGSEYLQYVEDNDSPDQKIVYVTEDCSISEEIFGENIQIQNYDQNSIVHPVKKMKIGPQIVDLEELISQQNEAEQTVIEATADGNKYQYAVLKEGKFHIQSYSTEDIPGDTEVQENYYQESNRMVDLSKITGKNLITGQTVTLDSYLKNIEKKMKCIVGKSKNDEKNKEKKTTPQKVNEVESKYANLLNTKITIGKTTNGKKLVGKIVHVSSTKGEPYNENLTENLDKDSQFSDADSKNVEQENNMESDNSLTSLTVKQVSNECFEHVSRTLTGLMSMDSIKKKLQNSNISVKVVERKINSDTKMYDKDISYAFGYMKQKYLVADEGTILESWEFSKHSFEDDEEKEEHSIVELLSNTCLTVVITYEKNGDRNIKVMLNPGTGLCSCSACGKDFRTKAQLKIHKLTAHKINQAKPICEICSSVFDTFEILQKHKDIHVGEGKLFRCSECKKIFPTAARLKKHLSAHNGTFKVCSVCTYRCATECALKKHLMEHMNVNSHTCKLCNKSFANATDLTSHQKIHDPCKYFMCPTCGRSFSRQSNLQRHIEIHKGAGALYDCDICGCSYHFVSSLTRHIVQNHIDVVSKDSNELVGGKKVE